MITHVRSSIYNANLRKLPNEYGDVSVINKGIHVAFLKRSQVTCLSCICTGKKNFWRHFLQSFRARKCFCAIIAIKHAFHAGTLTSAGPLGRCWTPSPSGLSFNTSLRAQQMLMNRKSCLIPILTPLDWRAPPVERIFDKPLQKHDDKISPLHRFFKLLI